MKKLLLIAWVLSTVAAFPAETAPRVRQNFDFDWRFRRGEFEGGASLQLADASWRQLDLPHDFSVESDFARTNASGTAFLPGGVGWYRKTFVVPANWKDKLVSVEFDGVSKNSEVWINGRSLGKRPYAYASFNYDLTPYLRFGATNVIAVRVNSSEVADSRWYVGSGIYRHVWLICAGRISVPRHGVYVTTPEVEDTKATVRIQTRIQNRTGKPAEIELVTELVDPSGSRVKHLSSKVDVSSEQLVDQTAEISLPELWSPETPALYRAVTSVRMGNKTVDELETTFGIRSIRFDAQEGFFLNDKPTKFKGLCIHHDAGALGAAVPEKVLERRLRLAREIGCNAIRASHNPMAAEFYDLCDRLGLMVMDEAFDEWNGAKRKWVQGWNTGTPSLRGSAEYFAEWAEADLREMILRGRNHPSIVLWSIGNEIDYQNDPFSHPADGDRYDAKRPSAANLVNTARLLIEVVREFDPSRPITAALAHLPVSNATGLAGLLDVVGYNYQADQYAKDLAAYPGRKFVGSENGPGLEYYELTKHPRVTGQFLWVGFDFLGEGAAWPSRGSTSGLFDTCGFLKPRGFLREALWSEKPALRLAVRGQRGNRGGGRGGGPGESHWNWENDSREQLPVEAYSNCDSVELFLNGESLGRKTAAQATNSVFRWDVPFKAGELKAVGTRDGKPVEHRLVTAGKPARIELIADQPGLAADGRDVAHIELRLVDDKGVPVPNSEPLCSVDVTGAGRLIGLDNGDQRDMTPLQRPSRRLNRGRALLIVQSLRRVGPIDVLVTSPGLPEARIQLQAR